MTAYAASSYAGVATAVPLNGTSDEIYCDKAAVASIFSSLPSDGEVVDSDLDLDEIESVFGSVIEWTSSVPVEVTVKAASKNHVNMILLLKHSF